MRGQSKSFIEGSFSAPAANESHASINLATECFRGSPEPVFFFELRTFRMAAIFFTRHTPAMGG